MGWLLGLAGAAIGLFLSTLLLSPDFSLRASGFLWSIVIFALVSAVLGSLTPRVMRKYADAAIAASGLVSTFIALLVTSLLTDGLTISGLKGWLGATLIIWVVGMILWLIPGPWRRYRADRTRDAKR